MDEVPEAGGGKGGGRKVALVAGLGLIAVGAYQLTRKPAAGAAGPPGATGAPGPPGPSGGITNYVVTATDGLIVRKGASRSSAAVGTLPYGTPVYVICQIAGENVNGQSAVWDRVLRPLDGYVWDWWLNTPGVGTFTPGISVCSGSGALPGSSGGAPSPPGLAPTGGAKPAPITDAMQLSPGLIVATDCRARAGRAYFIESANGADSSWGQGTSKGFRTTYRWKRSIANDAAWSQLGDPWRAIRIVTQDCLNQLNTGPDLRFGPILRSAPGWYSGPPLNGVINSIAGYCT